MTFVPQEGDEEKIDEEHGSQGRHNPLGDLLPRFQSTMSGLVGRATDTE